MGRGRKKGNMDLPMCMEVDKQTYKGKVTHYYRYRLPNGERVSLGKEKDKAIAAANALNTHFKENADLLHRVMHSKKVKQQHQVPPISFALDAFQERQAEKVLADSTRTNHAYYVRIFKDRWGTMRTDELTVLHIGELFDSVSPHSAKKYKSYLTEFCQFCTSKGWADINPAKLAINPIIKPKQRKPHDYDKLMQIRDICPPWLQRAIDLQLHSCQRPEDLVLLTKSDVDLEKNTLRVFQKKTENYSKPVFLEIDMHPELRQAVIACLESRLAFSCPYLIHYKPKRMVKPGAKPHHLAVLREYLGDRFSHYRNKSGLYDHITRAVERPGFYEIKHLGMSRIKKQYGMDYCNALAGHTSIKMTEHYLKAHDGQNAKVVSWR